jgi:hypothetical protein
MVEAAPGRLHLAREDMSAIQRIADALTRLGCQVGVFPGSREVTVPTDVDRRWLARVLDAHWIPCLSGAIGNSAPECYVTTIGFSKRALIKETGFCP